MKCTGVVAVLDEDLPVFGRDIVLIWDLRISAGYAEFHMEVFAYRDGKAVSETCAPECELVAAETVPLEVTVTAPDVCTDEVSEEVIPSYIFIRVCLLEPVAELWTY